MNDLRRPERVKEAGTSFFLCSRKSADLLPRTTRPGPRARTACPSLLSASRCRDACDVSAWSTQYGDPLRWTCSIFNVRDPPRRTCSIFKVRDPPQGTSSTPQMRDWPHRTWSSSVCGPGRARPDRARLRTGRLGPTRAHYAELAALDLVALTTRDWPRRRWSSAPAADARGVHQALACGRRDSGRQRVGTDRRSERGVQGE